ncbi:MAG: AAA family ATPase [Malacoplasma sp.]|nr:AAA family ATPase [Malacoplasma sp.]
MFKKQIREQVSQLIDEKLVSISRDIIEHVETGISSKELQMTLESMNLRNIELKNAKRQHFLFEKVLKLIAKDFNVYLYSMPGAGKTYMAQEIAKALKLDFYFSGAVLEPYKLVGYKSAKGDYIETDFYKCFKNGGLFLFDEMDASNPEALIIINAALANGFLDFPVGRVMAHEKFRLIGAGNTNGIDIGSGYTARQQLDIATLDRFIFLEMPYDEKLEEKFSRGYLNGKSYFDKFLLARKIIREEKLPLICSTRALILGLRLVSNGWYSWKEAFEMTVLKTALPKIKDRIISLIESAESKLNKKTDFQQNITTNKTTVGSSSFNSSSKKQSFTNMASKPSQSIASRNKK